MLYKKFIRPIRHFIESVIAIFFLFLLRYLPIDLVSGFGSKLAKLIGPWSSANLTAKKNLDLAMPELSHKQRKEILKETWDNFGRVVTEYTILSRLAEKKNKKRIDVQGMHFVREFSENNIPFIIFFGHLANWEIATLTLEKHENSPTVPYRSPNNPIIAKILRKLRHHGKITFSPKGIKGAKKIIQAMNNGGFIAMAMDQKMNTGISVPFFNHNAMTADSIARLSLRYNCPIIPMRVKRIKGCNFKVIFEKPWKINSDKLSIEAIVLRINQKIEKWIKEQPGQWLWLHKRWPNSEY